MNTRTTLVLTLILLVALGGFYALQVSREETPRTNETKTITETVEQELFDDSTRPDADKLSRVTIVGAGHEPWVFEKDTDADDDSEPVSAAMATTWRMTEPLRCAIPDYEVTSMVNRLNRLKYQVKYTPGQTDGISPKDAGLDPPRADFTLERTDGESVRIQVGKPAGSNSTYVRLGDAGDIYVARNDLSSVVKETASDYRDRSLLKFSAEDVVSVEITHYRDDEPSVGYMLTRDAFGDWRFEEPFSADAVDMNIQNMIRPFAVLRATEWVDAKGARNPGRYGLTPPLVEVEFVIEKKVKSKDDGEKNDGKSDTEDAEAPTPEEEDAEKVETVRETHTLVVARRGPIGSATAVYAIKEGDPAVATIIKSTADKLIPDMSKWRDMKLTSAKISEADRVEFTPSGGAAATLMKNDVGKWVFEADGTQADQDAVRTLLTTLESTEAVSYVDGAKPGDPEYGLTEPDMEIVVTIPGVDQPETFTIGKPTDPVSRRLYYVRRGESRSVAKLHADAVTTMIRRPPAYHNRSIFDIPVRDLKRLVITRPNDITGGTDRLVLQRKDATGPWSLFEPTPTPLDKTASTKLVSTVASLQSQTVVSNDGDPSAYGLNSPTITIDLSYVGAAPPPTDGDNAEAPSLESVKLFIAKGPQTTHAIRSDSPVIYELKHADVKTFTSDFVSKEIFTFEESMVTGVSVTNGGVTTEFNRVGDDWRYTAEPDLPIDPTRVKNLLQQISDIKLRQMVEFNVNDLGVYGLDAPAKSLHITTDDGDASLLVSAKSCEKDREGSFYATREGSRNVFLITPDAASRFAVKLDEFEKKN